MQCTRTLVGVEEAEQLVKSFLMGQPRSRMHRGREKGLTMREKLFLCPSKNQDRDNKAEVGIFLEALPVLNYVHQQPHLLRWLLQKFKDFLASARNSI